MKPHEYRAQCEAQRRGGWSASVAEVDGVAHAKRLDQLRDDIALAIHEETGIELCDIVVRLEGIFPDVLDRFRHAQKKFAEAAALREEASREVRDVVAELRHEQLTMRDISALLGITPQRVSQLVNTDKASSPTS
jgi:signal transduction histidine kinase